MTIRLENTPIEIKLLYADLLYFVLPASRAVYNGDVLAGIQIHKSPFDLSNPLVLSRTDAAIKNILKIYNFDFFYFPFIRQ